MGQGRSRQLTIVSTSVRDDEPAHRKSDQRPTYNDARRSSADFHISVDCAVKSKHQ